MNPEPLSESLGLDQGEWLGDSKRQPRPSNLFVSSVEECTSTIEGKESEGV